MTLFSFSMFRLAMIALFNSPPASLVSVSAFTPHLNSRPFIKHEDIVGVWRLSHQKLSNTKKDENKNDNDIVLRLNDDGSFDPYVTISHSNAGGYGLHQKLVRGGSWEYRDEILILAVNRPSGSTSTKICDTILTGKLTIQASKRLSAGEAFSGEEALNTGIEPKNEESLGSNVKDVDLHISIGQGDVSIGKFMYPKNHNEFFEEPILIQASSVGSFSATQILGSLNTRLKKENEKSEAIAKYHKKDFYGRRFYLIAESHGINPAYAEQDKHYDPSKVLHDIRAMPVTFHSNNTFSAEGAEKILRGRYGLSGEKRDRLWFQVSLFGAGRSAPGSVFSEGRMLSHDDQRGYAGSIQEYEQNNEKKFFIEGEYYHGSDFKRARYVNSFGTFSLREISPDDLNPDEINSDELEDLGDGQGDFQ